MSVPETNGRALVNRLFAYEVARANGAGDAASVVCQKLYLEVGQFIGSDGFKVLVARALHLARAEFPWLESVRIGERAPAQCMAALAESGEDQALINAAAVAVLGSFIDLLSAFIGDDLTYRMIHRHWPDVPLVRPRAGDEGKYKYND